MPFDLYDLRDYRVLDLSQNFSVDSPGLRRMRL
jgi:hypothetical protein